MRYTEDHGTAKYQIQAYTESAIIINQQRYTRSLIIAPEKIKIDWEPQAFFELTKGHVKGILEFDPEIVLMGTGAQFHILSPNVLAPLYEHNLGVECMDTGAACRTYTALMSEGRNVVAALLIPSGIKSPKASRDCK